MKRVDRRRWPVAECVARPANPLRLANRCRPVRIVADSRCVAKPLRAEKWRWSSLWQRVHATKVPWLGAKKGTQLRSQKGDAAHFVSLMSEMSCVLFVSVLRSSETCRFRVISKATDGPILDFLNRLVNHRKWNKKPLSGLHLGSEAILQFQIQSSHAEKLV